MKNNAKFERNILVTLSVMLVGVFLLSVYMYDSIAEGTSDGVLAAFAEGARDFVYENEAVAAFLGIEEQQPKAESTTDIESEAAAYIQRYNLAYANTK